MMEAARDTKSGKLDIDTASANIQKGEVPKEEPAKERKIDYEKAIRNNLWYQKQMKWDPLLFIKKPGIQTGTKEFADAIYDLQVALGNKEPDGLAGISTAIAFYD